MIWNLFSTFLKKYIRNETCLLLLHLINNNQLLIIYMLIVWKNRERTYKVGGMRLQNLPFRISPQSCHICRFKSLNEHVIITLCSVYMYIINYRVYQHYKLTHPYETIHADHTDEMKQSECEWMICFVHLQLCQNGLAFKCYHGNLESECCIG